MSTTTRDKAEPAFQGSSAPAAAQQPTTSGSDPQSRRRIEVAAYYRAQRRGFAPGHELDDWLAAEKELQEAEQRRAADSRDIDEYTVGNPD